MRFKPGDTIVATGAVKPRALCGEKGLVVAIDPDGSGYFVNFPSLTLEANLWCHECEITKETEDARA